MAERYDFYVHDNRKITFNLTEPIMREDSGVTDFVFHIPKVLNELEVSDWSWWLVFVNAKKEKYSIALTLSDDPERPLEYNLATYTVDYAMSIKAGAVQFALEAINTGTGGAIDNEWHTLTYETKVKETLQGNQAEYAETESDIISALLQEVHTKMNQIIGGATPTPVASVSQMTDTSKLYLLTTDGEWYYYNGTTFVSGGVYGAGVVDSVPTQGSANAVSSGGVYEQIEGIKNELSAEFITNYINRFDVNRLLDGRVESDGTITIYSTYKHSDFIPVEPGGSYSFYRWVSGTTWVTPTLYSIATYDKNFSFIENLGSQTYSTSAISKIDVGETAKYVVLSFAGEFGYSNGMFINYSTVFPEQYFDYTKITRPYDCYYLTPEMFGAVGDGITDDTIAFKKMLSFVTKEVCICKNNYKLTSQLVLNNINFVCYGAIYCANGIVCTNMSHKSISINKIYGANRIYNSIYAVTILNCEYSDFVFGEIDNFTNGLLLKADGFGTAINNISAKRIKCVNGLVFQKSNGGWVNGNNIHAFCNPIAVSDAPVDVDFYAVNMTDNDTNNSYNSNIVRLLFEWHYQYLENIVKLVKMTKANGNEIIVERLEITGVESKIDDFVVFGSSCVNNEVVANQFVYVSSEFVCKNKSNYLNRAIFSGVDRILKDFKWIKQDMITQPNGICVDRMYKLARINNNNVFESVDNTTGVSIDSLDGSVWPLGTYLSLRTKNIDSDSYIMFRGKRLNARCNLRMGNASDTQVGQSYVLTEENDYLNNHVTVYNYKPNPDLSSAVFRSNNNIALTDSMLHIDKGVGYIYLMICGFVEEIGISENLVIATSSLRTI